MSSISSSSSAAGEVAQVEREPGDLVGEQPPAHAGAPPAAAGQHRARHQVEQERLRDRRQLRAQLLEHLVAQRRLLGDELLRRRRRRVARLQPAADRVLHLVPALPDVAREVGQVDLRLARRVERVVEALARLALLVGRAGRWSPSTCSTAGRAPAASWPRPTASGSRACPCAPPSPSGRAARRGRPGPAGSP